MKTGLLAIAGACALCATACATGPARTTSYAALRGDPVDFSGAWWPRQPEGADFKPDPELTPAAQRVWDEVRSSMKEGRVVLDSTAACVPPGTPRLMTRVYPIQWIRYEKGYALIHEFGNEVRWIYLDGRKAPQGEDVIPQFNGYSVGRWEGRDLVVETTGFKTESEGGWPVWIQMGVRATPELKLVERYQLADDGKSMQVELTMFDAATFAKPWVTRKRFDLRPDVDIMEFTCLPDENVVTFKEDGSTTFKGLSNASNTPTP
jgi:hypothetical protein